MLQKSADVLEPIKRRKYGQKDIEESLQEYIDKIDSEQVVLSTQEVLAHPLCTTVARSGQCYDLLALQLLWNIKTKSGPSLHIWL